MICYIVWPTFDVYCLMATYENADDFPGMKLDVMVVAMKLKQIKINHD